MPGLSLCTRDFYLGLSFRFSHPIWLIEFTVFDKYLKTVSVDGLQEVWMMYVSSLLTGVQVGRPTVKFFFFLIRHMRTEVASLRYRGRWLDWDTRFQEKMSKLIKCLINAIQVFMFVGKVCMLIRMWNYWIFTWFNDDDWWICICDLLRLVNFNRSGRWVCESLALCCGPLCPAASLWVPGTVLHVTSFTR